MQSELKPCPFCGSDRLMVLPPTCDRDTPYSAADRAYPVVRCSGCYTDVPGKDFDASSKSAVEAWNRRAALSDKQAGEVKIKPLDVEEVGDPEAWLFHEPPERRIMARPLRWKGPDSSGEYHSLDGLWGYILRAKSGNGFWLTEVGGYFPTVEAARAAAQADYEQRIRSALVDAPAVESKPNELAAYWGNMAAVFSDLDITIPRLGGEQRKKLADKAAETAKALYTSPPLSREGDGGAETIARRVLDALRAADLGDLLRASDEVALPTIARALAATRSDSATTATGGDHG